MDYEQLPMYARADVIVCGGGTAGVFAAVAAAEQGADVLLIEQTGCVGGAATQALVTPMMSLRLPKNVTCSYLSGRLGAERNADPLVLGWEMEKLCLSSGVRVLYHMTLCGTVRQGNRIREVIAACKTGLVRLKARVFIDATGDADLCAFAGLSFERGNPATGANQPMSLRYILGGVKLERLRAFLQEQGERHGPGHTARAGAQYHQVYAAVMDTGVWALKGLFERAVTAGELLPEDMAYWQLFGVPGRQDAVTLNNPEFFDLTSAIDPDQLTQVQIRGRTAIFRQLGFYRKHFPGCEEAYVAQIAPMVGVRESRRVCTEYRLTGLDLASGRKFPDRIAQSGYPVDIHGLPLEQQSQSRPAEQPWFEVPFRCLVAHEAENLLVAGRCVGSDFVAQSALRIQLTCRSMGEAAGIAAAMAVSRNLAVNTIDGREVAERMAALGADFM